MYVVNLVALVRLVNVTLRRTVRTVLTATAWALNPAVRRPNIRRVLRSIEDEIAQLVCNEIAANQPNASTNNSSNSREYRRSDFRAEHSTADRV